VVGSFCFLMMISGFFFFFFGCDLVGLGSVDELLDGVLFDVCFSIQS
jgi:hypothetical protein